MLIVNEDIAAYAVKFAPKLFALSLQNLQRQLALRCHLLNPFPNPLIFPFLFPFNRSFTALQRKTSLSQGNQESAGP